MCLSSILPDAFKFHRAVHACRNAVLISLLGEISMIWAKLAVDTVGWAAWLWQNRREFEPVLNRFGDAGDFAAAAIDNPHGSLRRIGNTLVFGQPDGGEKVLAFIEQTNPKLEHITQAVDGLNAGQAVLSASLSSLQTLSMVTLGVAALTPIILVGTFAVLNRRITALQEQIADLHTMFAASKQAQLETGLSLLNLGQDSRTSTRPTNSPKLLGDALPLCLEAVKYYGKLLGNELNAKTVNRIRVRLQARHLSVAITGVASCQIGMEQDRHAFTQASSEIELLRKAASWIFHQAVVRDPGRFMLPAMRNHGITIELMANLYQHARDAGALPRQDSSAAAWFEDHREEIHRARPPFFRTKKWGLSLVAELQEAVAAIEETNRIIGLAKLVDESRASQKKTRDVMETIRANSAGPEKEASPFMVWGFD
jgi:hypothetical protein